MSNNSIIEHRANYYYIEFREEFLIICMNLPYKKPGKDGKKSAASPHCEALILSILENWTNNKRGRKEDLSIFMTYRQWSEAMYEMFGRTAIIDSLDELEGNKLLSRSHYKMIGNKDTYKYELKYQELNKLVRALPERNLHDTHPKTDASTNNKPVDPSKNERDASKNGRDTRSETDAYPSKNGHNITSTQNLNIASERESGKPEKSGVEINSQLSPHTPTSNLLEKMTELEQAFWTLWCSMSFNVIAPKLTEVAYGHVQALAPHITTEDQLKGLVEYSRQKLINAKKDGAVHLGNMRNDLNEWKQKQVAHAQSSTEQKRVAPLIMTAEETKKHLDDIHKQVGTKTTLSLEELIQKFSTKNKQEEKISS